MNPDRPEELAEETQAEAPEAEVEIAEVANDPDVVLAELHPLLSLCSR